MVSWLHLGLVRQGFAAFVVLSLVLAAGGSGALAQGNNAVTWIQDGLKLDMEPLGLDQVRAFFIARGFDAADADLIATTGCVYRSAIGNGASQAGAQAVTVDLGAWEIIQGGKTLSLMTREDWKKTWEDKNIDQAARVAFHWALFPTRQTFGLSDYNWGLITFGVAPGRSFDLTVRWRQGGVERERKMKNLPCPQ